MRRRSVKSISTQTSAASSNVQIPRNPKKLSHLKNNQNHTVVKLLTPDFRQSITTSFSRREMRIATRTTGTSFKSCSPINTMTTFQPRHAAGTAPPFLITYTSSTLSPNTPLTLSCPIPVRITNPDPVASQRNSFANSVNGLVNPMDIEQLRQVRHTKQIRTKLTSVRTNNPAKCVQITLSTVMELTTAPKIYSFQVLSFPI